ncbi:LolA family protein [Rathayibacter tanaceti]|uniref:Uncharacterized protein n=1 Tax=Rathayibacter tanaceti TaxID=1671680 RepID=A0A162IZG7_9MICO|nr:hypothetical protein [Rathayibacter tanaceti]KZX20027.1 hypothetical protein ACH61_02871 [Rathayibacter tanaceti]
MLTPSAAAERLLSSIDPTTSVAVGSDVRVAGRDAYELVLTPRDSTTLVGSATVSVDGETGLPLGVAVTARGATAPAFSIAYTSIDLSTPDASLFSFTPPAGAEVIEQGAPEQGTTDAPTPAPDAPVDTNREDVTTTGTGWGTIVELPAGDPGALGPLEAVTTPTEGGRVLSSALVTVLLTDDGRVLAGSVPVEALRDAAAAR